MHAVKVADEPKASPSPESASGQVAAGAPARSEPVPDPEVVERPLRRRFTAEFKRQVLAELDSCSASGDIGALLRRHGLYSSHLVTWRNQRATGELAGLAPKKRGRKPEPKNPLAEKNAKLERGLARMTARAERAERLVELQKKIAELFGEKLPSDPEDGSKS